MLADRLFTVFVLLAALAAIFVAIPAGTEKIDYGTFSPEVVPTALAYVIAGLALIQIFVPGRNQSVGPIALIDILRCGLLFGVTVVMVFVMERIGFLPASIVITACAVFMMGERRPIWFAATAIGLPALIWFVVTILLDRTLP
ncbi:tripartite tricarboxylate transporter TctB family protein [Ruegeria sp.]|uniref:tripartite tricarboxylate transporter TctB family protein n=1 Tax=Ruegeria sp. TaxID=1879320 RepID=UPI003B009A51